MSLRDDEVVDDLTESDALPLVTWPLDLSLAAASAGRLGTISNLTIGRLTALLSSGPAELCLIAASAAFVSLVTV